MPLIVTVWGLTAIIAGLLGLIVASAKRRRADAWALAAFIFPPSLIVLLLLPRASDEEVAQRHMRQMLGRLDSDD